MATGDPQPFPNLALADQPSRELRDYAQMEHDVEQAVRRDIASKLTATRILWQSDWILREEAIKIALGETT